MIKDRLYFFDAMRSILILFIVLIHVLQFFNPEQTWLIYTEKNLNLAPLAISFFTLFTLESFFMMSGYLAIKSIDKVGIDTFFNSRLKRILLPIIIAALTLNSLQMYLLIDFKEDEFSLYFYLLQGKWISHLWFLINLSIFFFLIYVSIKFFNPLVKHLHTIIDTFFKNMHLYIILFLFSFLIVIGTALFSLLSNYIMNPIINISSILYYFPFFLLGILLFENKKIFNQLINISIIRTLILTAILIYLSFYFNEKVGQLNKIAYYFFDAASHLFSSALFFALIYKFFNKKSTLFSSLSEASYSIYLVHHVLIVAGSISLLYFEVGGYLGLIILFLVSISLSFLIHHFLISKNNLLSFLYNGKQLKYKR